MPGRHWYAIHTYSGYENKVKTHLEARIVAMRMKESIFQVVVPTEDEIEIKGGQRRTVTRKVYPGYVLVDMVLDDETWHVVRNTPGVTGFVGGIGTDRCRSRRASCATFSSPQTKAGESTPRPSPRYCTRSGRASRSSTDHSPSSSAQSARCIQSATRSGAGLFLRPRDARHSWTSSRSRKHIVTLAPRQPSAGVPLVVRA